MIVCIFMFKQTRIITVIWILWCPKHHPAGHAAAYWQHRRLLQVAAEVAAAAAAPAAMKMLHRTRHHPRHQSHRHHAPRGVYGCRCHNPSCWHPPHRHLHRLTASAARNGRCCAPPAVSCSAHRCTGAPHRAACETARVAMTICNYLFCRYKLFCLLKSG